MNFFFKITLLGIMILLGSLAVFPLLPGVRGGYAVRAVPTGSMEPAIHQGSLIINQWTEDKNLQIGDVVTYRRPDQKNFFITHRIIKKDKTGLLYFFTTKGDQVPAPDPWKINQSLIEGKVIFILPLAGYLFLFTQSFWGFLFFILLPAAWIIFDEIKFIRKELKNLRRQDKKAKKRKNLKITTALLISLFFLKQVSPAYAYFISNGVSLSGINLSTSSQWKTENNDITPPQSSTGILADYVNQLNFNIPFVASDELTGIKKVELYYSRDSLGGWAKFGEQNFSGNNSVNGTFSFTSPLGEGYYRFLTVSTDGAGNIEYNNNLYFVPANSWTVSGETHEAVLVDTMPPVTTISVSQPLAVTNDQIYNGGFENGNLDGWAAVGNGTHQATREDAKTGNYSALVGNSVGDSLTKTVKLSTDSVSTLSFWYKLLTDDSAGAGFFETVIDNEGKQTKIVHDGWDDPTVLATDLGWKNVTYQLNNLLGKTVDLQFSVTEPDQNYKTWVYLDDIRLTATTNSAATNTQINFVSHDASGSGTAKTQYKMDGGEWQESTGSATLSAGLHQIDYFSVDLAGNQEATKSATISATVNETVDYGVVLNEFSPHDGWVEFYNNSTDGINVSGWILKNSSGAEFTISTGSTISPKGKLKIENVAMTIAGDTLTLLKPDGTKVDSFTYTFSLPGKSFKREPDGVGTWKDPIIETSEPATFSATIFPTLLPVVNREASGSAEIASESAENPAQTIISTPSLSPPPAPTPFPSASPTLALSPTPASTALPTSSPILTVPDSPEKDTH